jgi:hypothetical protein
LFVYLKGSLDPNEEGIALIRIPFVCTWLQNTRGSDPLRVINKWLARFKDWRSLIWFYMMAMRKLKRCFPLFNSVNSHYILIQHFMLMI